MKTFRKFGAVCAILICSSFTARAEEPRCTDCFDMDGPVLSLVASVDGAPEKSVAQLCDTARRQKVAVGQIMIVGYTAKQDVEMAQARKKFGIPEEIDPTLTGDDFVRQFRSYSSGAHLREYRREDSLDASTRLSSKLGIESSDTGSAEAVLRHFGIVRLPAWIVRYRGRDYVFQGNFTPSRLFTGDGTFLEGDSSEPFESTELGYLTNFERPVVNRDFGEPTGALLRQSDGDRESIFTTECKLSR